MKIAIFGGTFDPIHSAHLAIAEEAANRFALDRVLFIPAGQPPHKSGATTAGYEDRYRMVELATRVDARFAPSRLEEGARRSFSIDTIGKVRATLAPGDQLLFLIGADAFAEIGTWRRWQDVIRDVEFIVASRPGHRYDVPPGARVNRLETVALPISSSGIRRRLAAGETPAELPESVLRYIREHGLYEKACARTT